MKKILKKYVEFIFTKIPISKKKIIFCNFMGKSFGESPRYIAEALHRLKKDLDLVWLCCAPKETSFPEYIRPIDIHSIRKIYEIATASAIITNTRNSLSFFKRKGQVHLQTWHGCFDGKLVEKQIEHKLSQAYLKDAKRDGQISDGILVANEVQEQLFRKYFWLADSVEILRTGQPRSDAILRHKNDLPYIQKIKAQLGISADKFILYAPTFRDDGSIDGYQLDFRRILDTFHARDGKKWKILVRLHPNAVNLVNSLIYDKNMVDVTLWPDINDLLLISDVCITDYSSVAYECMLLDKPVFMCMLDFDKYSKDRGFSKGFFTNPFYMSYNCNDLIKDIKEFDSTLYQKRIQKYAQQNKSYDNGNASILAAQWILKKIDSTNRNK